MQLQWKHTQVGAEWIEALKTAQALQGEKALLLQPETGEGCKVSSAEDSWWNSVQCIEQGEPELCCATAGDAQPSHLSKVSHRTLQSTGLSMASVAFTARRCRDTSGLLPRGCERQCKVWSLPGTASTGTRSHQQNFPSLAGPDLLTPEYKQCQEKGICQCSGHTVLLQGHCSTRSWAALLLQMLLCRQGGSKGRINSVQAVVAENWRKLSLARNIVPRSSPLRVFLLARLKEGSNPRSGEKRRKTGEASIKRGWEKMTWWPSYTNRSCLGVKNSANRRLLLDRV